MKAYAGIGSRSTPPEILDLMRSLGMHLAYAGWTLRSGCAEGADSAFEDGAWDAYFARRGMPRPELFLPWQNFGGRRRTVVTLSEPQDAAFEIAARFHPTWYSLQQGAQRLHARNVHQVLGRDVDRPDLSRFVLCWTPGGSGSGGTGQALRIARHYDVPIFDLAVDSAQSRVLDWLKQA